MDVFKFRNRIISDYHGYVSSFISISQPRLREFVDDAFRSGKLWPDPLIQLNPTFKPGKAIAKLRRKWPTIPKSGVSVLPHATLVGADPNMEPVFILVAFRRFA